MDGNQVKNSEYHLNRQRQRKLSTLLRNYAILVKDIIGSGCDNKVGLLAVTGENDSNLWGMAGTAVASSDGCRQLEVFVTVLPRQQHNR